jgi:hypothetical protein
VLKTKSPARRWIVMEVLGKKKWNDLGKVRARSKAEAVATLLREADAAKRPVAADPTKLTARRDRRRRNVRRAVAA